MQTLKYVFGAIMALLPVVYCGGLVYYFLDGSGSLRNVDAIGLGPTVLGLTVVGLLFCIPFFVKLVRIFVRPGSPGSGGRRSPDTPSRDGNNDGEFDADAVIARHMARRPAEAAPGFPAAPPQPEGGGPARPSFGRKIR